MDISDLVRFVRTEHDNQPSCEDQVRVITLIAEYGYLKSELLTQSEIESRADQEGIEFDCADARPALDNLVDLGVLTRQLPAGGRTYVISNRLDEIINGRFEAILVEDREALIKHIQDEDPPEEREESAIADGGDHLRTVVADAFSIVPDSVEAHLRAGQPVDQRNRLNTAIDAIRDNEDVSKRATYGKIVLRQTGYRYQFSKDAIRQIADGGETDADIEEME